MSVGSFKSKEDKGTVVINVEDVSTPETEVVYTSGDDATNKALAEALTTAVETSEAAAKPVETQPAKTNHIPQNQTEEVKEKKMTNKNNTLSFGNKVGVGINAKISDSLNKFVEHGSNWLKSHASDMPCSITLKLITNENLYCPVVAVSGTMPGESTQWTHLLLIDRYSKDPVVINKPNNVEVKMATSHAYNPKMRSIVKKALNRNDVKFTGHTVVYAEMDLEAEETAIVQVFRAMLAVTNKLGGYGALSLKDIVDANRVIRSYINIAPGTTDISIDGQPIATDLTILLKETDPTTHNNKDEQVVEMNGGAQSSSQLLRANAIFDVVPQVPTTKMVAGLPVRTFGRPGVFITNVEGVGGEARYEDGKAILAAAAALLPFCAPDKMAAIVDRQVRGGSKTPVGVMGMYHDTSGKGRPEGLIPTAESHEKADKKLSSPRDIMEQFLESEGLPFIGFDLVQGAPMSWALDPYHKLLFGTAEEKKAAKEAIYADINAQGKGGFEDYYNGDIIGHLATLHNGTFRNADDVACSLSSIDNLALMGICNGDQHTLAEVISNGDSLCRSEQGVHARWKLIEPLVSPVFKGYVQRVFFIPKFYAAYIAYLKDSGIHIQDEGIASVRDTRLSGGISSDMFRVNLSSFERNVTGGANFNAISY